MHEGRLISADRKDSPLHGGSEGVCIEDLRVEPLEASGSRPGDDEPLALDGWTVRVSRERRDPAWDSFVARCPGGHHEQTSLWGEVKGVYGWQGLRIVVAREDRILGGVQILIRRVGRWGRIGYVSRGPLAVSNHPKLIDFLLAQLHRATSSEGLLYLALVPPYNGQVFEPGLKRLGFSPKPNVLPPGGLMPATLLLDLSPELGSLLAGMQRSTRRNVRYAARRGVTVREGTEPDVELFRQLMWTLCERRKTRPTPPQKDFFEHLWRVFHPAGLVRLFIAELEGQAVSAVVTFPFGDAVKSWKVGWTGDHAKSYPNEMMYWEAIRWARSNGYRTFDFVGIDDGLARMLENGESLDVASIHGADRFKVGFGGRPLVLPRPCYRFYHPLLRFFALAGGRKLIESPRVARLVGRFWDRLGSSGEG
jgi:lipid II:glycine glycyltransferase (peptidoglycan interpeptide bridge formation enzyme)